MTRHSQNVSRGRDTPYACVHRSHRTGQNSLSAHNRTHDDNTSSVPIRQMLLTRMRRRHRKCSSPPACVDRIEASNIKLPQPEVPRLVEIPKIITRHICTKEHNLETPRVSSARELMSTMSEAATLGCPSLFLAAHKLTWVN
jgi:hypothetical protein